MGVLNHEWTRILGAFRDFCGWDALSNSTNKDRKPNVLNKFTWSNSWPSVSIRGLHLNSLHYGCGGRGGGSGGPKAVASWGTCEAGDHAAMPDVQTRVAGLICPAAIAAIS